ncbi:MULTISPECIES: mechanosensitive ion channel family protein [Ramlibacter]|uniref:Small-conductance mechanosensitive ion channel n=1 Tax=Ramlibacter pinisoli TaxID=2682844 RepID=A0A6N8INM4_9BURK|nr:MULTISPECIES: small-conductance mechanosensitive ion channel [Ramlibacter]MBA2963500.1 small-conductance mechanosensitive ion channel [Ramlibacter sp. CGMCC 1.13660]MVQ28467.1 small-conductance mechanosensitive ion channel [Ramlibacter pinisoli]
MTTAITDWSAALMTSLAAALAMFLSAIPKIIGFAVIVIVGWLLSALVEKAIAAVLRTVKFNDLAGRSGLGDFVQRMGTGTDPAGMIGLVAKWFIRLIALVVAFDALGLPAVSDVLRELLLWLPNVVVALVVLVIGGLAARALSNLVRGAASEAGISNANLLAKVASALVWTFAIVVAVNQIGIATTLVNTLFMAFVGAIALGLGLAFGLGGRETASQILNKWYAAAQDNAPRLARAAEAGSEMAREQAAGVATGGYGSGSAGGGYQGGGSTGGTGGSYQGTGYAGGPQYPTDGGPRTGSAGASQGNDQMYPTPSAPRHPSEGGS